MVETTCPWCQRTFNHPDGETLMIQSAGVLMKFRGRWITGEDHRHVLKRPARYRPVPGDR